MGGAYTRPTAPHYREGPFSWPSREQREAYIAALQQLYETYPPRYGWQEKEREEAIREVKAGYIHSARLGAIAGGVPEGHLMSIEALLL